MEELLAVAKKQLRFQKIISALLAILVALLIAGGVMFVKQVNQMSAALDQAVEKIQEIDVNEINDTITSTREMMESVEEFSTAVDEVTAHVKDFDGWVSGIFGNK